MSFLSILSSIYLSIVEFYITHYEKDTNYQIILVRYRQTLVIAFMSLYLIFFNLSLSITPFVYVIEVFRQNARAAALTICIIISLLLEIISLCSVGYLNEFMGIYIWFIHVIFAIFFILMLIFTFKKVHFKLNLIMKLFQFLIFHFLF
jgi:hypothetical protein